MYALLNVTTRNHKNNEGKNDIEDKTDDLERTVILNDICTIHLSRLLSYTVWVVWPRVPSLWRPLFVETPKSRSMTGAGVNGRPINCPFLKCETSTICVWERATVAVKLRNGG